MAGRAGWGSGPAAQPDSLARPAHSTAGSLTSPRAPCRPRAPQILRAGEFLALILAKAHQLLLVRRARRLARLALLGLAAVAAFRWLRHRAAHRAGGGGARR